MKFCLTCNNMMYIKVSDDAPDAPQRLSYICKHCNSSEACIANESICVVDNNYVDKEARYKQYMSKYLKHDMTLPHVTNIDCPNDSCTSRGAGVENDVIIVKYDFENMKYMYHCVHCETFWRT